MKSVADHLSAARDELRQAHEKAPLGTKLMIQDVMNRVDRLYQRVQDAIEDDNG